MESEAGSAVEMDPFSRIPDAVLTTHLLPILMAVDVEGLTSLMAVSSHFRKVAMAKLTKKDWVQKMFGSKSLREHFRSGTYKIEDLCEDLPEWKSVTDNYFNHVYSLTPNYPKFIKFLEVDSTTRLFGTLKEQELWIFQKKSIWSDKNGDNVLRLESNQDLANFLLSTVDRGEIESNPFRTRAVSITLDPEVDMLRALKNFGTHVRWAYLSKSMVYGSCNRVIMEIGSLLEQMPGIQDLRIAIENKYADTIREFDPLPDLPNLTHLDLTLGEGLEGILLPFIKYSDQITTLSLKSEEFLGFLKARKHPNLFPNLERLSILVEWHGIMSLRELTCPLKEIKISFDKEISLQQCFEALQSFSGTLVAAELEEYPHGKLDMKEPPTVDLPNLRVLSIGLRARGSLDGLLGLTSVGYLKIEIWRDILEAGKGSKDASGEIIKLWEKRDDLHKSNVWSLMPALNEVWLEEKGFRANYTGSYTRAEYMKRQEADEKAKQEKGDTENENCIDLTGDSD